MKYLVVSAALFLSANVCLAQDNSSTNDQKNVALANSINEMTKLGYVHSTGSLLSFSSKEDTKGSRYLYSSWVKGTVTDSAGKVYDNKDFFYNFDKITNSLYLTSDKKEVIQLDQGNISKFSLTSPEGKTTSYVKIASVKPDVFFEVLVDNASGYSLYKLVTTKFTKANFHSDGLTESGKNYDEYADDDSYYIALPGAKEYKPVTLTKKSIKKSVGENPKAESYVSEHKYDNVDEHFMLELVQAMNG